MAPRTKYTRIVVRVYRYRLYPTRAQDAALRETLWRLRELYNACLQERRSAYRDHGVTLSGYRQMAELREVREVRPEYAAIHTHLLQDVVTRLDRAYRAFFRRCKSGETPGFPRFKGRGRYRTFTFKDAAHRNGVRLVAGGARVDLTGIGKVKVKLHRPIVGTVKQVSVTLSGDGHWYVAFACDGVPVEPLPKTGESVGVDVGITTFAALSNGELVENPRCYETALRSLKTSQRQVSRRKRGSHRRRKAVVLLAKQHDRVRRTRLDFQHRVARDLVERFDSIAVENLNVKGLARMRLAKQVHDAGWAQFTTILASAAERANREFVEVDPRGTSQECSGCGAVVRKSLAVRVHHCPECGLVEDRDVNAAKNVQTRGHRVRGGVSSGRPVEPRSPYLAVCGR
jgi:putative transposase